MTWVALPWFVLTTTGSAAKMTLVIAVEAAAIAVAGFAAGNLTTRIGPRRTILVADACRVPLLALVPLLHLAGMLSLPLLLVLVFAIGAFATPSFGSKQALIPEIVGEDEGVVAEANALMQTASRLAIILGPSVAGALIGVFGATTVLLIDAATFLVGFALVAAFVRVYGSLATEHEARGTTAGIRFLLRDRLLRPWTASIVVSDVAWYAVFAAIPVLVLTRFGEEPEIVGWIFAGFGIGAVAGTAIAFRIVRGADQLLLGSLAEIGMVAPLWLLLLDLPSAGLVAVMAASGFANGLGNAPIHTIFLLRTPRALRGKVWAGIVAVTSVFIPFALISTGPALERAGVNATLVAILSVQSTSAVLFTLTGLRERATPRHQSPTPEAATASSPDA